MSRLVVVVPLKEGAHARAKALVEEGPPFELEETEFDRHHVFLTQQEAVFVFEAPGSKATLSFPAEDVRLWKAAAAWAECMASRPRKAQTVYFWERVEAQADS